MDDVVDELDLRPLVALDDVLGNERMQPEMPSDGLDDFRGGLGEVDPDAGLAVRQQIVERVRIVRLGDLPTTQRDDRDRFAARSGVLLGPGWSTHLRAGLYSHR